MQLPSAAVWYFPLPPEAIDALMDSRGFAEHLRREVRSAIPDLETAEGCAKGKRAELEKKMKELEDDEAAPSQLRAEIEAAATDPPSVFVGGGTAAAGLVKPAARRGVCE